MQDLQDFLLAASERSFSWAEHDCISWLGTWVAIRHGSNPADGFTGRYRSRRGALRLIREHGGLEGLIDAGVVPLGLERTVKPRPGDIALVRAPEGIIGGIVTQRFIANVGLRGLFMRRLPILTAWRV